MSPQPLDVRAQRFGVGTALGAFLAHHAQRSRSERLSRNGSFSIRFGCGLRLRCSRQEQHESGRAK
jgi:hypothetical protein